MNDVPESGTGPGGISIRLLAPGDEHVVRELATYDGPGDPEALLADPRTLLLVAFDGERPVGFVLTELDNGPANALYRSAGGATEGMAVQWEFSYEDD